MLKHPILSSSTSPGDRNPRIQASSGLVRLAVVAALFASLFMVQSATAAEEAVLADHLKAPERVELASAEEFHQILEHHKGKVILVNFWATWCIPCVQELPELNELQKRFRDKEVLVVGVSLDDPEGLEDRVRPFFKKRAPELVSYLSTEDEHHLFVRTLDPEWMGVLPTSYFIDREGAVRKSASGRVKYQVLEKAILDLVEE